MREGRRVRRGEEGKSLNAVLQDKLDRHGCTKLGYKFNEPLIFGTFTLEYASNLECKSRQFLSSRIFYGFFARTVVSHACVCSCLSAKSAAYILSGHVSVVRRRAEYGLHIMFRSRLREITWNISDYQCRPLQHFIALYRLLIPESAGIVHVGEYDVTRDVRVEFIIGNGLLKQSELLRPASKITSRRNFVSTEYARI